MIHININDQTNAQPVKNVHVLNWQTGSECCLRTLIEERVRLEHERVFQSKNREGYANDLIKFPRNSLCSLEEAIETAIKGFEQNSYFIIVDGEQQTALDQKFILTPNANITFVKLVPLQGG